MGLCTSCTSTIVATSKLILQDGKLQEFSYPVRVAYILSKNPNIFICNSDDMQYDDVLTAVDEDDELQPGQLYFALPLSKLRHPLLAEEMAALAVKANAAMKGGGGEKCGCRKTNGYFGGEEREGKSKVADLGSATVRSMRRSGGRNGGKRSVLAKLSAIPE
ncbi:hypothetical protein RND81_11G195500 [Saponaria officinalis]|uniref:Uncharacterized protein n=1 Tax=Saponaria officinalis TaxID=3572 RepID=A0AAW1HP89_SAPOF